MRGLPLSSLSDSRLLAATAALVQQGNAHTAILVQHLVEVLRRGLHRNEGYARLSRYCVGVLHMSEWSAHHHAWAAGLAQRFPEVLDALADGRVHLAGLRELGPYLTKVNTSELLAMATHRTRREIQELLAAKFPKPDLPTRLFAMPAQAPITTAASEASASNVQSESEKIASKLLGPIASPESSTEVVPHAPASPAPPTRVDAASPGRYVLQTTLSQETHDLLMRAQDLLAHVHECRELEAVLNRALSELVTKLEARKFGDTSTPRASKTSDNPRYVPASTRRAVAERDQKRCTFVNDRGERCSETAMLEYDHIPSVARGGKPTRDDMRLLCRAHNQLAAERTFGRAFMQAKRDARSQQRDRVRERAPGYGARARNAGACERRSHGLGREHEPRSSSRHSGARSALVRGDQRRSLSAALPRTAAWAAARRAIGTRNGEHDT